MTVNQRLLVGILAVLWLLSGKTGFGLFLPRPRHPRTAVLGGPAWGKAAGCEALYGNPADLQWTKHSTLFISCCNLYGIGELTSADAAASTHVFGLGLGVGLSSFGFSLYRETEIRTAVAGAPLSWLALGLSLKWLHLNLADLGTRSCLALDFGLTAQVLDCLQLGMVVENLNRPCMHGLATDCVERRILLGAGLNPAHDLLLTFTSGQNSAGQMAFSTGLEYALFPAFSIRCGWDSNPTVVKAGFSLRIDRYRLAYFISRPCNELGTSQGISLSFLTGGKNSSEGKDLPLRKINLNRAGLISLSGLPGLRPRHAAAIIAHRKQNGPFCHIQAVCRIQGISYRIFHSMRHLLAVDERGNSYLPLPLACPLNLQPNRMEMADLAGAGVSPLGARNIILYRDRIGGFRSATRLTNIPALDAQDITILRRIWQATND